MIGRPGGRIGVDVHPRNATAQGVWRLNEILYAAQFQTWPIGSGSFNPTFGIFKSGFAGYDLTNPSFAVQLLKVSAEPAPVALDANYFKATENPSYDIVDAAITPLPPYPNYFVVTAFFDDPSSAAAAYSNSFKVTEGEIA